jgi:hypothetical protein
MEGLLGVLIGLLVLILLDIAALQRAGVLVRVPSSVVPELDLEVVSIGSWLAII